MPKKLDIQTITEILEEDYQNEDIGDVLNVEDIGRTLTGDDNYNYPDNCLLSFKYPLKLVIAGASGCGKSYLTLNIVIKCLRSYDKLVLIGETIKSQPIYDIFLELAEMFPKKFMIYDNVKSLKLSKFSNKENTVVILDDIQECSPREQEKISSLYTLGRHYGLHPIYICQSFYKCPIRVRGNATSIIIFYHKSLKDVSRMYRDLCSDLEKDNFLQLYREATSADENGKYNFLTISPFEPNMNMKYRKNMNCLFTDPPP